MRLKTVVSVLVLVVMMPGSWAWANKTEEEVTPRLASHMPRDPLLVSVVNFGNLDDAFDGILGFLGRFGADVDLAEIDAKLAELDGQLGCSLRKDLLAGAGPEVAVVLDLPPIDSLMSAPDQAVASGLAGVGILVEVNRSDAFDACLQKLLELAEFTTIEEDDLVRLGMAVDEADPPTMPALNLYYGYGDGVLVLGGSEEFVRASRSPRAAGERLADGEDYSRVFAHLERDATDLTYVNLPRVAEMVRSSMVLQSMIGAEPEAKQALDIFLGPDFTSMGFGSTSTDIDGGVRTTTVAPPLLSGGAASAGIIAAIAIPNLLNAVDRGKQKRTMADIRSAATACEEYAVDTNAYPGPTDGWVPLANIKDALEPVYIRVLPREDGWGHPLMYWSDSRNYLIVSPGKDGALDRDWRGEVEPRTTQSFVSDIVFGDGSFVVWPEGKQE
jgi:general secretion pathway protein G